MEQRRCYGCMELTDQPVCPRCGSAAVMNQPHQLSPGTVLGGRILVGKALGQTADAVLYLGLDQARGETVNLLEFFPAQSARRNGNMVEPAGKSATHHFAEAKGMFIKTCRALTGDRELADISGVREAFEENGTTYLVSERIRGTSLDQYIRIRGGALSAEEALRILGPVFRAVAAAHRAGVSHGSIRMSSIALSPLGGARIQGFGETLGFQPQEDVLALSRVLLGCLVAGGEQFSACPAYVPGLTPGQISALKMGMSASAGERFASAGALYEALVSGGQGASVGAGNVPQPGFSGNQPEKPRKKHGAIIAACIGVFVLVLAAIVVFGIHVWKDPDCTHPKTCAICGKSQGNPLGHDWQEAGCDSPMVCDRCGELQGQILGHDWQDATCYTPQTCARCGKIQGEPLEHAWQEATYTEPSTCSHCGATRGTVRGYHESVSGSYERFYSSKVNGWCLKLDEPVIGCRQYTLVVEVSDIDYGDPAGSWKAFYRDTKGNWIILGNFTMTGTSATATFTFPDPVDIDSVTAAYDGGAFFSYSVSFAMVDVYAAD